MTEEAAEDIADVRRAAVVLTCGVGFCAGLLWVTIGHPPAPLYDPLTRTWLVARSAPAPAMAFFGHLAYGAAGALGGGLIMALLSRRRHVGHGLLRALLFALLVLSAMWLSWETLHAPAVQGANPAGSSVQGRSDRGALVRVRTAST